MEWVKWAFSKKTSFVSSSYSEITTGTFDLIIPAFSFAIFVNVSPKILIWSKPILVMTLNSGLIIFVESRRPPKPTSITATSTFSFAKKSNAIPTLNSKKKV